MAIIKGWLRHRYGGKRRPWHYVSTNKPYLSEAGKTACGVDVYQPRVDDVSNDLPTTGAVCRKCIRSTERTILSSVKQGETNGNH